MTAEDFWNKVKARLSEQGKTFVWLCEQANVDVQIMKNRIYKGRIPDVEDTLKLLAVLGTTVEEFFGVEEQFPPKLAVACAGDMEKIPVFEQLFSCGKGQFAQDSEYVDSYIAIPDDLKTKRLKGHLAACKIRGDSMEPTIFNGDTIICDDYGYQEDGIYAILFEGKSFVKRLQRVPGGMKIISDNPAYESMFAKNNTEELKIIGKVYYILHKV